MYWKVAVNGPKIVTKTKVLLQSLRFLRDSVWASNLYLVTRLKHFESMFKKVVSYHLYFMTL